VFSNNSYRISADNSGSLWLMFRCVLALTAVVAVGSLGFMLIENWPAWKSIYFTLITITTVGYGDEGLSPHGKAYAAALVIGGIGVATYSLSLLVQTAVNYHSDWRKKMQDSVDSMQNHVIVCGFGRMGRAVCEQLVREEALFVVIDPSAESCEKAIEHGFKIIQGNAADDGVLAQAGIDRARALVCAAACDAENVFITLSGRELNKELFIVSRADGTGAMRKLRRAGASLVVSPHQTAGSKVATTIVRPQVTGAADLDHDRIEGLQLDEIFIDEDSPLCGQTVAGYGMQERQIVFVAIIRSHGERIVQPRGDTTFQNDDIVVVVGQDEDLARMKQIAGCQVAVV